MSLHLFISFKKVKITEFFFSFRSPHSNEYQDPIDDGAKPSDEIRELEIQANQAFDSYRDL